MRSNFSVPLHSIQFIPLDCFVPLAYEMKQEKNNTENSPLHSLTPEHHSASIFLSSAHSFIRWFACLLIVLSLFSFLFMEMQNLLFYYENENSSKPSGIIFLEGSYCERLTTPPSCVGSPVVKSSQKEDKLQVSYCYCTAQPNKLITPVEITI